MKKILLTICLFILLPGLPKTGQAASLLPRGPKGDFVLQFQDQEFKLPALQLSQNRGIYQVPKYSNLRSQPLDQTELARELFNLPSQPGQAEETVFHYNPAAIYDFVKTAANAVAAAPQEPSLSIEDGRAVNFTPPADGIFVDIMASARDVLNKLENEESESRLIYSTTSPKTLLSGTNALGINELIAHGVSNFKGSPKNRIHNIQVGVEKFKGLIIKKNEEFSFNKYLGPVEKEEGFLPELVIKASGTVPELGGGLCQVSSTTFRAAMQAGLPITQRKNHAYAVSYYSPQGTDATIYPGIVDLKFVNDTPGDILVWPHFEDNYTLIFDFYGTADSRKVTLETPRQYDRKSDGSLKAEWTRVIEKNGAYSTSTFKSIYLPPALFHKQEQFVSATGSPAQTPAPTVN